MSTNIASKRSKFDEIINYINEINKSECELDAICVQESSLSNNDDTSLLQIPGHTFLPKSKHSSGLIIYLRDFYNYEIKLIQTSNIWEGQLIQISGNNLPENII